MSAVMKFGPRAVEYPFVEVKQMITDLMNKLQFEAAVTKSGASAGEDPFARVKDLITDSIERLHSQAASEAVAGDDLFTKEKGLITDLITDNRLHSESSSEANHHDDELVNAGKKKADLESQMATDFLQFSVSDGEIVELQADLGTLFAQQLKTDAIPTKTQQHTAEQIVDVLVSPETAQEHFVTQRQRGKRQRHGKHQPTQEETKEQKETKGWREELRVKKDKSEGRRRRIWS